MTRANQSWMVSPKSFVRLLGAEYGLMRDAGVLKRFYISSLLIVLIMLLTWVSIDYAINLLFKVAAIEILLAVFFCLLFVCIYVFLLNTFAKENKSGNRILNASNIIRTGFIAFIGYIIAQPIVILFYTSSLTTTVNNYKQHLLQEHINKIDLLVKDELIALTARQQYCIIQREQFGASMYDSELSKIDSTIKSIQGKADSFKEAARQRIEHNSFFLYQVQKVNHSYPLAWLLTALIVLLFLLPGYLIYTISNQHEYYILKKAQEKKLVMGAYHVFVAQYKKLFVEQVAIFSRYENPPFNTIRKQPPVPASMTDFLQKYLGNG